MTFYGVDPLLVVDDFGVKYVDKKHAWHLVDALKKCTYQLEDDWEGKLYCNIGIFQNELARRMIISCSSFLTIILDLQRVVGDNQRFGIAPN